MGALYNASAFMRVASVALPQLGSDSVTVSPYPLRSKTTRRNSRCLMALRVSNVALAMICGRYGAVSDLLDSLSNTGASSVCVVTKVATGLSGNTNIAAAPTHSQPNDLPGLIAMEWAVSTPTFSTTYFR